MIFKAILSNGAHPEYGVATIPFPVPSNQYNHTIELLEAMAIRTPTAQDCRVDELTSRYPILNWLVTQSVNLGGLDYLVKRLGRFCTDENTQFQAIAPWACQISKTYLTFCSHQDTGISGFTNLEES